MTAREHDDARRRRVSEMYEEIRSVRLQWLREGLALAGDAALWFCVGGALALAVAWIAGCR